MTMILRLERLILGVTEKNLCIPKVQQKKNAFPDAYSITNPEKLNEIWMDTATFNQRHPATSEFIAQHEHGHSVVKKDEKSLERDFYGLNIPKNMSELVKYPKVRMIVRQMTKEIKSGTLTKDNYMQYEDKIYKALNDSQKDFGTHTSRDQLHKIITCFSTNTSRDQLHKDIMDIICKNKVTNSHGLDKSEYKSDYYASTHMKDGKKAGKEALKDLAKMTNKQYKDKKGTFKNTHPIIQDIEREIPSNDRARKQLDELKRELGTHNRNEINGVRNELKARMDAINKLSKNRNADYIKNHK